MKFLGINSKSIILLEKNDFKSEESILPLKNEKKMKLVKKKSFFLLLISN